MSCDLNFEGEQFSYESYEGEADAFGETGEFEMAAKPQSVLDPRIDVHAPYAMRRMFKSENAPIRDLATALLQAVKSQSQLGGIYIENQQVPALLAKKKLGGVTIINIGSAPFNSPGSNPPLLIHEFAHSWQSQHHSIPWANETNSVASQGGAVTASKVAAGRTRPPS